MPRSRPHRERHRTDRVGWLRAAVLGANDGIVSTGSLIVGVAAAQASGHDVIVAAVAAVIAGAMSMAAGEYVSVSSQGDTEKADVERERKELATDAEHELSELVGIYVKRGLDAHLAKQVAAQLTAHDALGAHARDELGISPTTVAQPVRAAVASAGSFAVGAMIPLLTAVWVPHAFLLASVISTCLFVLAVLGGVAARVGGASVVVGATRVTVWGALAMGLTTTVGLLFGR